MKRLFVLLGILFMVFGLSACSGQEDSHDEDSMKWVDVNVTIDPEKPQANEPVMFKAAVTYGDEVVTDAREVTFEIWRANDEKHEEFEIEKATDGVYQLEKSFEREGTYYIIAHVTAKSMHHMPKEEFVVGTPSEPEVKKSESEFMKGHDSMDESKPN